MTPTRWQDPHRVQATLGNGLRVSALQVPSVHTSVLDMHLCTGSRFETRKHNGISHFLEHMLHRGTARHPSAHLQALAFENLGAALSAATYVDHGTITLSAPPENLAAVVPLLAEVLLEPIFSGIEVEKGIVREEILEGLDEDGRVIDPDNLLRSVCFEDHPLGFPITGDLDTLERFDVTLLKAHHRARYTAQGIVLTLAGAVEPERAIRDVEAAFLGLLPGAPPTAITPAEQLEPRFFCRRHSASQVALRVGFRAPSERDPDEPATELLLRLLDDGMATRLYERLCDERGLCYDVAASYEAYSDAGLLDVATDAAPERLVSVLREIFAIAHALADDGPSADEIDKAKRRFAWQLAEQSDEPISLAAFYGLGTLTGIAESPRAREAEILAVPRERVRSAAQRIFRRQQLCVIAVGPVSGKVRDKLARETERF